MLSRGLFDSVLGGCLIDGQFIRFLDNPRQMHKQKPMTLTSNPPDFPGYYGMMKIYIGGSLNCAAHGA
jgi:hypothetical protein